MVQELHLSSNELLCYALIYGFSQDYETEFTGSLKYIQTALNVSKNSAVRTLQSLCDKNLIRKVPYTENNITSNRYVCINIDLPKQTNQADENTENPTLGGVPKMGTTQNGYYPKWVEGCTQNGYGGVPKMGTHNNTIYNINNINTHTHENAREEENGVGDSREDFYSGILSEFLSNDIRLEAFCMNNHTNKIEFERIGKEIINEWMIAPPSSVGRNDVSRHLLASIKKRIKDNGTNSTGAKPQYKSPQDRETEEFARQRRAMAAELAEIEKRHAAGDYGIGWDYSPVDRNRLFNDLQPELTDGTGERD
jgi:hypothetical protein